MARNSKPAHLFVPKHGHRAVGIGIIAIGIAAEFPQKADAPIRIKANQRHAAKLPNGNGLLCAVQKAQNLPGSYTSACVPFGKPVKYTRPPFILGPQDSI